MMPALGFSGVIMPGDTLDNFQGTQGNNLLPDSQIHLPEL